MEQTYYMGNRNRFCEVMESESVAVIFAGKEIRKTNDEYYPFFTDRNFLYLTGLDSKEFILMMRKDAQGQVTERVYILAPDRMAERWTGRRLKPTEVRETSGIEDVRYEDCFEGEFIMKPGASVFDWRITVW